MGNPVEPVGANLKAEILAGARHATTLSAPDRRVVVTRLIEQSVDAKLSVTGEIFQLAYGDRDGRSYWLGWLTEDFSDLYQFIRLLEIHNGKARDLLYISRSPILEAFAIAARARPSWLRHVSGESRDLGRSNHPAHLAGWEICRGPAVDWLLQHPELKELLPSPIADAVLEAEHDDDEAPASERMTPQKQMCREAFAALYPNGIPSVGHKSDKRLAGEVQDYIEQTNRTPPSKATIIRAAGRKRAKPD